jgi:hypothetical protein
MFPFPRKVFKFTPALSASLKVRPRPTEGRYSITMPILIQVQGKDLGETGTETQEDKLDTVIKIISQLPFPFLTFQQMSLSFSSLPPSFFVHQSDRNGLWEIGNPA